LCCAESYWFVVACRDGTIEAMPQCFDPVA
jgi:hypothetical protein